VCVCVVLPCGFVREAGWVHSGSGNGPEGDVCGHFKGEASRKGRDLFVNIHFKRFAFPTA